MIWLIVVFIVTAIVCTLWGEFYNKNKDQKDWIMFHKKKPDRIGWYLCTVEQGSRFPMLLYWDYSNGCGKGVFTDPVRKSVFNTYEVMVTKKFEEGMKTDAIMPDDEFMERIYTDEGCDRTKYVIAWKPEPKVFMGEVKTERNTGKERASFSFSTTGLRANFAVDDHSGLSREDITKFMNLSYADIERIVNEYNKLGNVNVATADELRAILARATEIKAYDLEGNVVAEFDGVMSGEIDN